MPQKRRRRPSQANPNPPERDVNLPQVAVRFSPEVIQELDQYAADSQGRVNRSDLIREGVYLLLPILRQRRNVAEGEKT